jgi:hypothetical protein
VPHHAGPPSWQARANGTCYGTSQAVVRGKGFVVLERQDLVVCGVAIHNYQMAKTLD